jgi:2Fe-2S ferredoxin
MGGSNPYIDKPKTEKASRRFKITFQPSGRTIEIDPNDVPSSATGLEGSILDIALAADVDIDHACGGVCACSTCHVIVKQGLQSCNEAEEAEEDQLETAPGLTFQSRLACQCVPNGTQDLIVEIPNWNRNLARE